ncbi:hypothetical protein ABZ912_38380 [Nonomuraea angiospora]|uniref:hypothetical protein n=1 Tax=Nonomuraea angiospora TaxID=46172 RepID=UPI0033EE62AE
MTDSPPSITDLAVAIRPRLLTLLGEEAEEVDAVLGELLARGVAAEPEILTLLQRSAATREWAYAFLRLRDGGGLRDPRTAYFPLGAAGGFVAGDVYGCEECEHRWHRRAVGQAVPSCPQHDTPLIRIREPEL